MARPGSYLSADAHRRRAIEVWSQFCVAPLRLWQLHEEGPPPCALKERPVRGATVARFALSPHILRAYLRQMLALHRAGHPVT